MFTDIKPKDCRHASFHAALPIRSHLVDPRHSSYPAMGIIDELNRGFYIHGKSISTVHRDPSRRIVGCNILTENPSNNPNPDVTTACGKRQVRRRRWYPKTSHLTRTMPALRDRAPCAALPTYQRGDRNAPCRWQCLIFASVFEWGEDRITFDAHDKQEGDSTYRDCSHPGRWFFGRLFQDFDHLRTVCCEGRFWTLLAHSISASRTDLPDLLSPTKSKQGWGSFYIVSL